MTRRGFLASILGAVAAMKLLPKRADLPGSRVIFQAGYYGECFDIGEQVIVSHRMSSVELRAWKFLTTGEYKP